MKVAFAFLLISALVLLTQQQRYPLQTLYGQILPPWNFEDRPSLRDIYDYLYARTLLQQYASPTYGQQAQSTGQLSDILPRQNAGLDENPLQDPRFFFNFVTTVGSGNSYSYLKTIYYVSSTTATTTLVSTCIPAASYTKTLYTVPCKKRREVMGLLLAKGHESEAHSEQSMLPSKVQLVEPSVEARALELPSLGEDAIILPVEISGSKTEDYLIEKGLFSDLDKLREKRFLIASTTITSYVFVTTSSTKTLSNLGSSLSCLPSQFLLC